MYCIYWKHADEIVRHASLIEALLDYMELLADDTRGLELWFEPAAA